MTVSDQASTEATSAKANELVVYETLDEGRIARIWPKVSIKGHAEEVLAAATAL